MSQYPILPAAQQLKLIGRIASKMQATYRTLRLPGESDIQEIAVRPYWVVAALDARDNSSTPFPPAKISLSAYTELLLPTGTLGGKSAARYPRDTMCILLYRASVSSGAKSMLIYSPGPNTTSRIGLQDYWAVFRLEFPPGVLPSALLPRRECAADIFADVDPKFLRPSAKLMPAHLGGGFGDMPSQLAA
jgi:hypothetical protein